MVEEEQESEKPSQICLWGILSKQLKLLSRCFLFRELHSAILLSEMFPDFMGEESNPYVIS